MAKTFNKKDSADRVDGLGERFVQELLEWNREENDRAMPWKGELDPYRIWISEVILQQTRVEQGLKYYEKFINAYPDVHALAKAPDSSIYKNWEGLGYYSRCANLIATARFISGERSGVFPDNYESIRNLKGIGNYTASAIASFAYNLPYAVLDGNVYRVLSRIFNNATPIDTTDGRKLFANMAQKILPKKEARAYNQAIMDFGATVCKPVPLCADCFFSRRCGAYLHGTQDLLPVKVKKQEVRERWFNYFIIRYRKEVLIHQRTGQDIWKQLYEFLLLETDKKTPVKKLLSQLEKQYPFEYTRVKFSESQQRLSHQLLHLRFFLLTLKNKPVVPGFQWIKMNELDQYAFPRSLVPFIQPEIENDDACWQKI